MAVPLGLIRCELQLSSRTARNMSVNESHRCRWVAHPAAVEDTSWCWRYGPLRLMSAPMSLPTVSPLCHASGGWECCPRQIQSSPCLLWWTTSSHGSTDGTAPGLIQFNQLPSHKFDHFVESKNNNNFWSFIHFTTPYLPDNNVPCWLLQQGPVSSNGGEQRLPGAFSNSWPWVDTQLS